MSITSFSQIPKWMLPGGQLWGDPRVEHHWEATRQAVAFATHLGYTISQDDIVATLMGITDGVAYTSETDQERKDDPGYAPITSSADFWLTRPDDRYEDRSREWPEWVDAFADEGDKPRRRRASSGYFVPSTGPYQEWNDNQRSAMVDYIYKNAQVGKKWAKSKVYMYASLAALDNGKTFKEALEIGYTAYCANFKDNIASAKWEGLWVWNKGKCKLLPWKYIDPVLKYFDYTQDLIQQKYLLAWACGTL